MQDQIDLAGRWQFRLDPDGRGSDGRWWRDTLADDVTLPGSLQAQGYGYEVSTETDWVAKRSVHPAEHPFWWTHPMYEQYRTAGEVRFPYWMQPQRHYVGQAWYQREISVPEEWRSKRVVLVLERCHWTSRVWVDDDEIGAADSLSTPHVYDLTDLQPGPHRLTIMVDNRLAYQIGSNSSSVTDHSQTAWNGIVGSIALEASDPIWIADVQIYPNPDRQTARCAVEIGNVTGRPAQIALAAAVGSSPPAQHGVEIGSGRVATAELEVSTTGLDAWDEFEPTLHTAAVRLTASSQAEQFTGEWHQRIGLRHFTTNGTQFAVNGRTTFLRGTVECCEFPQDGYPATDVETWRKIMAKLREYGLNHMRFHSWCPPEAAFEAADEAGVYLHAEGPLWAAADDPDLQEFLRRETAAIQSTYGNHPSFVMFGLGNESLVEPSFMTSLLDSWKRDPRRRYTSPANNNPSLVDGNDYYIAVHLDDDRVRTHKGWPPRPYDSWISAHTPATTVDYRTAIERYAKPLISHEVGQRCVYPDPSSAGKYDGSLRAAYLDIAHDQLIERGMRDQVSQFVTASGKWQVEQYKEEIEAALRTPGFGGFQLLQLNDFPGQGMALVGLLDVYWDEKGYVSPVEWQRFCAPTTPLLRLPKRIWISGETISADIEVAHFGASALPSGKARYSVRADDGTSVAAGDLTHDEIGAGTQQILGTAKIPTHDLACPARYRVTVDLAGRTNAWDVWVYADHVSDSVPDVVVDEFDSSVADLLEAGASVLIHGAGRAPGKQSFTSIYWDTPWTDGGETQTLGILTDPAHPALQHFPTDAHTNWHWHELLTEVQPVVLDGWGVDEPWPDAGAPIVQMIDDWNTNRKLAIVAEARVGNGKVVVCAADLATDLDRRIVARQFRHSLVQYMSSAAFSPAATVSPEQLRALLAGRRRAGNQ